MVIFLSFLNHLYIDEFFLLIQNIEGQQLQQQ
jgi:hypothetical protein